MRHPRLASIPLLFTILLAVGGRVLADETPIRLVPIGTYSSGIFNAGGAEIVAHDPRTQRLFVVNAQAASVDVLSIKNPSRPRKVDQIDVSPFGAVTNSVAIHEGLIAVAVENADKTDPGMVAFFDRHLRPLNAVRVGALPDMLTFSANGRWLLVANEGEPDDTYTIDPEGSISIIDMRRGAAGLRESDVRTANFRAFNRANLDPSIRVFGPDASVQQDFEPEYIAISRDSRTAWVTCQENNALAIVDIAAAKVTRLVGLGFKDHNAVKAKSEIYEFDSAAMPSIGKTAAGQKLFLGGFSGLHFEGIDPKTGRYQFITHTDRGPNAEPTGTRRPFLLPDFTPEIIRFELDPKTGALRLTQRIPLQSAPGVPLTGLPNTAISDSGNTPPGNIPYNDEVGVDLRDQVQRLDPLGGDLEGLVRDPNDGTFWMVDEYRPAIYHFDKQGLLIQRYVPIGTAAAAGESAGTFGKEVLPEVLAQRRQNRGFEAVAYDRGKIYAFVQSTLRNPVSLSNSDLNGLQNIRVVEFDPTTETTKQFIYVLDNPDLGGEPNTRADKIGDAVSLGNGEFLVVERDDDSLPSDEPKKIEKKIYRFNLGGATDVSSFAGPVGATGKTVDQLTVSEMLANEIQPIDKVLHVDLNEVGYNKVQKVEGLALIDSDTIAVINDNDFGVANILVNTEDGTFTLNYVPEPIQLGIIETRLNGLDASDRDGKINIRRWPIKGMYLPDGIASFRRGGETYLITANEGDSREYAGFTETVRIEDSSVILDPAFFPNAAVLKEQANLGRLTITKTLGKNSATGLYEQLFAFGARSFSIWNAEGELAFDSGDALERITAEAYPANFNASNTNNTFDNRSDDKGPEPEGVVVGEISGRLYAFIGLERIGGVVVYNIDSPAAPRFVEYVNHRDFTADPETPAAGDLGPEGVLFIPARDSPNGRPLLVVGNEISGTTTIFQIRSAPREHQDAYHSPRDAR
jgi:hypothetical protein